MTNAPPPTDTNAQLLRALSSLKDMRSRLEAAEGVRTEPIAVIGMGCRLPGAANPSELWDLLRRGGDAITETPAQRWETAGFYDPEPEAPGKVATRWGGFLDDIDRFDASFFGISPREAAQMDPQQRLLLEVAWEALEDGGQTAERLAGSATGVFVGVHSHSDDYYTLQAADPRRLDLYSGTGTSHSVVSGRLSYLLDLRGPSLAIDSACSSSLVAVHLAVQSLRDRDCSLALAGGVNSIIDPTFTVVASRMRMMSASGRCRPFDARADGFVRSEGCAVVLLKRLSDAVADGDRVLAVIKGSAVNQDGRSNGLTAPNSLSQQAVIRAALANAGLPPAAIGLIEAHGTGTPLGDPIEVEALTEVFGGDDAPGRRCVLGSAKANIGHTEGAAGVAALIKTVLTLRAGEIPALVHFDALNPHISLAGTPFVIPTAPLPWPASAEPRAAGVSSFGWSGTNAHVIVEEAPRTAAVAEHPDGDRGPLLLPVSARHPEAVRDLAEAYRALLDTSPPEVAADICAGAALRRSHHEHRLCVVGRHRDELVEQLDAFLAGQERAGSSVGHADAGRRDLLVFVLPGQGSQWPGMARQLIATEPVFRDAVERCAAAISPYVDWSLVEHLTAAPPPGEDGGDAIDVVQPTLFAIQVALAALWRAHGVQPDAVVGHSMGEVAAAHIAGVLSLDDAARVICTRSRLLRRIAGRGAMAVVELGHAEAGQAIAGLEDRLSVAVSNSATSTVLSGDPDALDEVMARLVERDVFCRRVKVDVASHSPQVDGLRDDLIAGLDGVRANMATVAFVSTVTARFEDGPELDAGYWARNLRQPVLFADAVQQLIDTGYTRFVELSPHPVLLAAVRESLDRAGRPGVALASMQRDGDEPVVMGAALGGLYADGAAVDWTRIYPGAHAPVDLPAYPWQRERYWLDESTTLPTGRRGVPDDRWLGWTIPLADPGTGLVWENDLDRRQLPSLYEHRIGGVPSVPASAVLELMHRAAGSATLSLSDVRFEQLLPLHDGGATAVQVARRADGSLAVHSRQGDRWMRHATATAVAMPTLRPAADRLALDVLRARLDEQDGPTIYRRLLEVGVELGPALQCIASAWSDDGQCVAAITGTGAVDAELLALDACLQVAALAGSGDGILLMPVSARSVERPGEPTGQMTCHVTFDQTAARSSATTLADVVLYDDAGAVVAAVDGLVLQRLDTARDRPDDWFYDVEWRLAPEVEPSPSSPIAAWVVLADEAGHGDALVDELRATGGRCLIVRRGGTASSPGRDERVVRPGEVDDLRLVFEEGGTGGIGVVYLWGLDGPLANPSSAAALADAQRTGGGGLVSLARAMTASGVGASMWVATRGVHRVEPADDAVAIALSPLWGLGRVIAEELPDAWGGLIDLDPAGRPADAARSLAQELLGARGDGEVARRGPRRYVPRLARHAAPAAAPVRIGPDGTYLVTGGFGALGAEVARWLVAEGARRVILLGRTALPPRAAWSQVDTETPVGRRVATVLQLERAGAAVHTAAVDVGDAAALTAYLDEFRAEGWPPIRGVFHTAAVFGGQLVDQLETPDLLEQLLPKVVGAWALSEQLADLDHFVLFSSIASLLPVAGQAGYAAGNAFLDALAHCRKAQGRAGLSVNWGFWDGSSSLRPGEAGQGRTDDGVGYKDAARVLAEAQGLRGFRTEQGLEALGRLMHDDAAQAVVVPVDWTAFAAARTARPLALTSDVVEQSQVSAARPAEASGRVTLAEQLSAAAADERDDLAEAAVRRLVGGVLRLPEARIDRTRPFGTLGLDSLMAIELRNRLEAELGFKLSATMAWNYPTVKDLGAYVLSRIAALTEPAGAGAAESGSDSRGDTAGDVHQMAAAVADLSDDDALLALMDRAQR